MDHLDVDEQRAYIIAYNALTLATEFDEGKLMVELNELQQSFDLKSFGLDTAKFEQTIGELQTKELQKIKKVHY